MVRVLRTTGRRTVRGETAITNADYGDASVASTRLHVAGLSRYP
jgi:hypothetical protein